MLEKLECGEYLQVGGACIKVQIHSLSRRANDNLTQVLRIILNVLGGYVAKLAIGILLHQTAVSDVGRLARNPILQPVDDVVIARANNLIDHGERSRHGGLDVVCYRTINT